MKSRLTALLAAFAALLVVPSPHALVPVHAQSAAAVAPAPAAAPAQATAASAKTWLGRHAEFEEFLKSADIDRFVEVPIGVTKPKRAYFKPGGLAESVAWKALMPGRPQGYWESYKSEIAGYEIDKLLGMDMVPPSVEKKWKGETAAAILWLTPIRAWKDVEKLPKPAAFDRQISRMKMFDDLIGNKDRNMGNLLVDDQWNLFLIDHSRAFVDEKTLPFKLLRIDRALWDKMLALDEASLTGAIGKWIGKGEIRAILARRDKMKVEIEKMVKASSEAAVFF